MTGNGAILAVKGLHKGYRVGGRFLPILQGIDLELQAGEILAVVGQSGSGKSTLLHQIGLLDKPEQGEVLFRGEAMPLTGPLAAWAGPEWPGHGPARAGRGFASPSSRRSPPPAPAWAAPQRCMPWR